MIKSPVSSETSSKFSHLGSILIFWLVIGGAALFLNLSCSQAYSGPRAPEGPPSVQWEGPSGIIGGAAVERAMDNKQIRYIAEKVGGNYITAVADLNGPPGHDHGSVKLYAGNGSGKIYLATIVVTEYETYSPDASHIEEVYRSQGGP